MQPFASRKLDFAIVGAAKSSTSAVADYLDMAQDIHIMKPKDGHYFLDVSEVVSWSGPGDESIVATIKRAREGYVAQLSALPKDVRVGDASVFHMTSRAAMSRLRGAVKEDGFVIILLRRPDERAYSAYTHMVRDGFENLSFVDALSAEAGRKAAGWQPIWWYKELGMYHEQVANAFEMFGRENVFVILFEDVTQDVQRALQPVLNRLGAGDGLGGTLHQINSSGRARSSGLQKFLTDKNPLKEFGKKFVSRSIWLRVREILERANLDRMAIPSDSRSLLISEYRDDILALSSYLGRDLSAWLK